jgi:short-subunit dehydrogenase
MRPPIDSGTVLITGACSGIGREIARQLAHRARTLVLVGQVEEELEELRARLEESNPTLGVVLMTCDISRPGEVGDMLAELARHFIRVDVLVNAVSVGGRGLFARQRWGSVERLLLANVVAPLMLTRRLLGPMLARGQGGILQLSSGASQLFLPGSAAYVATLRCLDGFIESLRLEVEGTGVVITQAALGPVNGVKPPGDGASPGRTPFFQVSAARCAREALAAFERGEPLVYPGRGHRWVMTLLPRLPRAVRRALGRWVARDLRERSREVPALRGSPSRLLEEAPSLA